MGAIQQSVTDVATVPLPLIGPRETAKNEIGIATELSPWVALQSVLGEGVRHVVQKNGLARDQELVLAKRMLLEPQAFMLSPLASILRVEAPTAAAELELTHLNVEFSSPYQKEEVIRRVHRQFVATVDSDLLSDLLLICDELVTNATLNAPIGGGEVSNMRRKIHLLKNARLRPAELKFARDQERILIACTDNYGTLDPQKLFSRINDGFIKGVTPIMNFAQGGAGVGAFMVFQACASIYVGVVKGQRTTVCASLPVKGGRIRSAKVAKNIHYFCRDAEPE